MLNYTGKLNKQPKAGEIGEQGQLLFPYLPSPEMVEAVNLAIQLERPLLLKGEPGSGKTKLAQAVAYELQLPLEAWYIKSTSRAKDGLYTYDTVARLRDAQLAAVERITTENDLKRIQDPASYIKWGPIGRAFLNEKPTVVLIDEIDKADIDFPNDLLLELDEKRFFVEEVEQNKSIKEIRALASPIVFITSNDEKDLPDAFLRRCLFHYVEFPSEERLEEIIYSTFPKSSQTLIKKAIARFEELREDMRKDKGEGGKKVSTSELIDWFNILRRYPEDQILKKLDGQLPFPEILLKSWDDHKRYLKKITSKNNLL